MMGGLCRRPLDLPQGPSCTRCSICSFPVKGEQGASVRKLPGREIPARADLVFLQGRSWMLFLNQSCWGPVYSPGTVSVWCWLFLSL
ncbi:hypothetical protein HP548_17950 [Paenibacillus taichungensis]|uniref:Uncharacterized protein n=1 Tax=Paenibacillus taichungensis TaxID=484184 RepID=A0ABX2MPK3_9BACL|nr:hypothetical protein [Paenibacillus taichungensis]PIH57037.1 hypothetical protein CS562_23150 [Paenibacillus sp. LK1]